MRKKIVKLFLFYFALTFVLCTCNDPIFYEISKEVKPIDARIKGVPTNFAVYDGIMYVASGETLYTYKSTDPDRPYWGKETPPGGNILQVASTGGYLYALCSTDRNNDGKTVIKQFNKANSSWTQISGIIDDLEKVHDIFAANDMLFITASTSTYNNIFYTVLYIDNSGTLNKLIITDENHKDNTGEINGAAFDGASYYLSFLSVNSDGKNDSGVYKIDNINAGASLLKHEDNNVSFTGIINLQDNNNTILLIARNGDVYTVKESIVKTENVSMGKLSTGALAIWRENDLPSSDRLLLAGRQDSLNYSAYYGYTYGYLELELDANGIKSGQNFVEPGINLLSTVAENERYHSTIGKHPVNYLFQVPSAIDSNMILFASTQKSGVWSYRVRDGIPQWNAEGEDEPAY